ncbi:MAG TPA: response regulator, partial [Planctomycetota bacterium]|nr:response regulator [Planctomycetota bacterium]
AFARILVELAREQGFKAVVSLRGAGVPALARELKPDAITLDIHLGDGNGWHLLDRLKHDPHTRHIPVHVITVDDERARALRQGALGALTKPATRDTLAKAFASLMRFRDQQKRHLLVVEDDETVRQAIIDTVGNGDVLTTAVGDAEAALAALARQPFDCIVLDLGLPGISGQHLLDALHDHPQWREIPVIIYTARDLGTGEEQRLRRTAKTIVLKTAASLDRLLDETALFLHRVHSRLPDSKRQRIERVHQADSVLTGRTVLVVDDDVRNVFALTSLLERYGMTVATAENGREALTRLAELPEIALVLMDIMMPEMDGYTAMRAIRAEAKWQHLPILALTAKAMKGDREQCLAAGAFDYITKPVDSDQLLSMLRVWLYR